jgi:peptidoglycan/LPS O-acetylase OafA/YrhL
VSPHKYRPDIDGLRAVAVLGVLLFHAGFGFSGGYTGVDVFFVISGFLITRLIQQEVQAGTFSLAVFWERRIRRILPALVVMVGCTLAAGTMLLVPTDLAELAESSIAQALMGANVYFWQHAGYFDGPTELKPLLHTWSLAVEEQFYLVFPLLIVACRRLPTRPWLAVLCGLSLGSFALSVWGTYAFSSATFYLLPTRAWELAAGAVLANLPPHWKPSRKLAEPLAYLGMAGIAFSYFCYSSTTRFPGVAALVPCLGTALVIGSSTGRLTSLGRMLALRPLVLVGLISYSLYLWHWPILALLRYRIDEQLPPAVRLVAVTLSVVLAILSWRFIEQPFRRARGVSRARVFQAAIATSVGMLAISGFILGMEGFPSRFPEDSLKFVEGIDAPRRFKTRHAETVIADQLPLLGDLSDPEVSFLVWGDSHAMVAGDLLEHLAAKYRLKGVAACRSGTAPLLGTWRPSEDPDALEWNQAVIDLVKRKRFPHVLLIARWESYVEGRPDGSLKTLIVDEQSRGLSPAESKQVMRRSLRRTIAELEETGATVWIMRQVPLQARTPVQLITEATRRKQPIPQTGVDRSQHLARQANANEVLSEFASANVHILDPDAFCFDEAGRSRVAGEGRSYYCDADHLSRHGADQLLRPVFEPVFAEISAQVLATRASSPGSPQQETTLR